MPEAVLAPIIDALLGRTEDLLRGCINYRDLSVVSHLGGIYERLLEYSLPHEVQAAGDYKGKLGIDRIVVRPASFARKVSGSDYPHDDPGAAEPARLSAPSGRTRQSGAHLKPDRGPTSSA